MTNPGIATCYGVCMEIPDLIRHAMDLEQIEGKDLAERIGKLPNWVSRRLTTRTRLLVEDAETMLEGIGWRFDWAVVPEGQTVDRRGHTPEALEAAQRVLDVWSDLDAPHRRMLVAYLRSFDQD